MSLKVGLAARVAELLMTAGERASSALTLRLFSNDHTPAEGDTEADYTEVLTGNGYAAIALATGSWSTDSSNPTTLSYAEQAFTFTGAPINPNVYGYFLTWADGKLAWAERLPVAPFVVATNGDAVKVTVRRTSAG